MSYQNLMSQTNKPFPKLFWNESIEERYETFGYIGNNFIGGDSDVLNNLTINVGGSLNIIDSQTGEFTIPEDGFYSIGMTAFPQSGNNNSMECFIISSVNGIISSTKNFGSDAAGPLQIQYTTEFQTFVKGEILTLNVKFPFTENVDIYGRVFRLI